jgi:hypothetical protein
MFVSACTVAAVAIATLDGANLSRQQAESLSRKITLIAQQGQQRQPGPKGSSPRTDKTPPAADGSRRTPLSEGEVNSWFAYRAPQYLPVGVTQPSLTMIGNGTVKGEAVLDLDTVGKRRAGGSALSPWSLLGGRVPVSVLGILSTKDGQGRFELQQAEVAGVPVPSSLLEELVSYYARTPEHPDGVRLNQAFDLPANIRRIEVAPGQMVVVQ